MLKTFIDTANKKAHHSRQRSFEAKHSFQEGVSALSQFDGQRFMVTGGSVPNFYLEEYLRMKKEALDEKRRKQQQNPGIKIY